MRTMILAAVLAVAVGARADKPAPVDKPVAPIKSAVEIVASLPKELAPDRDGWTEIQKHLADKWAATVFAGKSAQFTGVIRSVGMGDAGGTKVPFVVIALRGGKAGTVTVADGLADASFPPDDAVRMAKAKPGDSFTFHGTIAQITMSADREAVSISITLDGASVGPAPR